MTLTSGAAIVHIDLRKPDLRAVPINTQVTTSKGFNWVLLARFESGEVWRDVTSTLQWGPIHKEEMNHHKATEKYGCKLPTKEEFEIAEEHGIREILPMDGMWFWSSSVYPNSTDNAYYFNGGIGYGSRSFSSGSAVCVSR